MPDFAFTATVTNLPPGATAALVIRDQSGNVLRTIPQQAAASVPVRINAAIADTWPTIITAAFVITTAAGATVQRSVLDASGSALLTRDVAPTLKATIRLVLD